MAWGAIFFAFGMSTWKFLFAAAITRSTFEVTLLEIYIATALGGLFSFNLCYWSADYLMGRAKRKKLEKIKSGKLKPKKNFTRLNKSLVKLKMSQNGLWILATAGTLFMSLPVAGIVLAKFYGSKWKAYSIAVGTIILTALLLTLLSDQIAQWVA